MTDIIVPQETVLDSHAAILQLMEYAPANEFWTNPQAALAQSHLFEQRQMEYNMRPPSVDDLPAEIEPLSHGLIQGAARTTLASVGLANCFTGLMGILGRMSPGAVATAASVVAGVEQLSAIVDDSPEAARDCEDLLWQRYCQEDYVDGATTQWIEESRRLWLAASSSTAATAPGH